MQIDNKREEKQKKEEDQHKKEYEDKNKIKSASELAKFKVPKISKNLETEVQIERTSKVWREAVGGYKKNNGENYTRCKTNTRKKRRIQRIQDK